MTGHWLYEPSVTIYAYFHVHTLTAGVTNGLTITQKCSDPDGNCKHTLYTGGTATLDVGSGKTYDGQPYAGVSASYVPGSHDITENATFEYFKEDGTSLGNTAPTDVGTYKVAMTWYDATTDKDEASFTIEKASISSVTLKEPTVLTMTGNPQSVAVDTVMAGSLTVPTTGYTISGDTQTNPGDYKVTVTGTGNYTGTATADWKIKAHEHDFNCVVSDGKLTVTCKNSSTCTIPDGTSLEIICDNAGITYDGNTVLTAYIKDNTSSPFTFETYTSGSKTEIAWDDATPNAGDHTASFKATVAGVEYTISKTFTIEKKDITGAVVTLSATSFPYSGAEQSVTISSVKIGDFNVTYTEDADSVSTAKAIGTHTVKITANGNFVGAASANWQITNYSGSLKSLAAAESGVGTIEGNTLTVTDSSKLEYDSANQVWYAGLVLTWDHKEVSYWDNDYDYGYAVFTKPAAAQLTIGDTTYSGSDAVTGVSADGWKLSGVQAEGEYNYSLLGGTKDFDYLDTTTLKLKLTPDIIEAAKSAGVITLSMYAGSLPFKEGDNNTQWSNGVKFDTYTINIPIDANLKLFDEVGNQVYPDAGYVAQVAETKLKYTNLCEAVKAATAGQTINALAACEAGAFAIAKNVTLNLADYGADGATYTLDADDGNKGAKVTSSKKETVTTTVTGFDVAESSESGVYTYAVYRAHIHLWEAVTSGAALTATCTNDETVCDLAVRTTSITLTVTGGSDGVAPTFAIDNKDDFLSKVNKFGEVASIGEITVVRNTDDGAAVTKWYVGSYTASCIVTINGEAKTISQDFAIAKSGEYATGYAVASRDIRYDSLSEAVAAAEEGDTIYYRNGNLDQRQYYFSVDKDVTLDCRNATFAYTGKDGDMEIYNNGVGTLTMKNVTVSQPVYGSSTYHNISLNGGNFAFGTGVVFWKASDDFTVNVMSVNVAVADGLYHCAFAECGTAKVEISGGVYLYTDHCKPQTSMIKSGYVVVEKSMTVESTTVEYYEVVPHSHDLYYETAGNVITLKCQGAGYEGCDKTLNTYKLTLTAADAFEGATYTGASYTYDAGFEFDDKGTVEPVIEYYLNDQKVDTPSAYGSYEARVTVTVNGHTATAVKAFVIKHVHQFKYDIAPSATLTATCTNEVSDCDVPNRSTAITLTVTDNGDGNAPTFAIANQAAFLDFVNRDAMVATIGEITTVRTTEDGAATTRWYVGNYRSTCVVTISGVEYVLTQDFSIAKPSGGYTSGWEVGSTGIRYIEDDLTIVYATAKDGDTIYYRDGDRKNEEHAYSDYGKNLTFDFGGYTLTKNANVVMTLKNTGTGVLTFQNVTIMQPKGPVNANNVETEGNIRFGVGVKVVDQDDDDFTITANSGMLQVTNGLYNCKFDTDGGTNEISGGKFWSSYNPSQYVNVNDHLVREIEGDYKYEVVEHTHVRTYKAEGAVIACVCEGEDAAYCGYNKESTKQTATLVANDAAESTEPYAGASVTYTQYFPVQPLTITYWNGETQLEGAPTRFGTYTAKITAGDATAVKDFTISPMQVTVTVRNPTNATLVVYEGEEAIASETEEYSVKHGSKVTAIYTAEEGYSPAAVTNVIESAENGDVIEAPTFTTGPSIVEPIGGDPEETPEIKPVEGTNGVYVIEVKTNTTTAVEISGLGGDDTVIVPPQIDAVHGTEANPIATNQVKIVADATNTAGKVQVDITPAFTISESGNGVIIELNSNAVVTVEIAGKAPEDVRVLPELGTAAGTTVAEEPFVVADDKVATGVKAIPGLTYNLLSGDSPTAIKDVVKTIVAEDTRIVLEAAKELEKTAKFYKIEVVK